MEDRANRTTTIVVVIILILDIIAFGIMNYRDSKFTKEYNAKVNDSNVQEFNTIFKAMEDNGVYLEGLDTDASNIYKFSIDEAGEKLTITYNDGKVISIKLTLSDDYNLLADSVRKYSRRNVSPIEDCIRSLCGIAIPFIILTIIKVRLGDDFSLSPRGDYDDEVGAGGGSGDDGGGGE